jgi:hypothetical protein
MIFKFANQGSDPGDAFYGKNGVAWVLRFGGLAAMVLHHALECNQNANISIDCRFALSYGPSYED